MTAPLTLSVLVLLVEDHREILDVLEEALTDGGFFVATAASGEEALTMLDAEGASYRALITDVNFRGPVTGWDVAKHARELNDLLPVIYMTGASAHDWGSRGVPNSVLLLKPFALAQLVTAVSHLVTAASTAAANTAAAAAAATLAAGQGDGEPS